ncbi:iron complex outermembrane receptor protein [Sphingomonas vulcanisoli]|uniref:Iron complex outermembrane receptor protein n=1 Tax=Sphingomonas vulcanisoli TaxID=1658060 RepID=A0ABX0TUT4_9SPHN|nr:TonB-dependent receptor [Sphingomonas vulcanisoli]NIJ08225.1 iron complex outermembrane receptor protein [Sphingomonas vulcanisoli]
MSNTLRASALLLAFTAAPVRAAEDIVVTAPKADTAPTTTRATIDATTIAERINLVNTEDAFKYLPSLLVRKRHIGDTQAPLATRTSGVGSSARSLIYADGALLSALIGNNNSTASPRWSLVAPEEIARIDVLYGPFSAAYPGNSIGAVVSITTRLPDRLEATINASSSFSQFSYYGHSRSVPAKQIGGTIGDRFGRLALFAAVDHVDSTGQPLSYITATQPAGSSPIGTPITGSVPALNRTGAAIRVLGEGGIEHQVQDRFKLKAAYDLTPGIRLTYAGALFLSDTHAGVQSYLGNPASGDSAYAGSFNIDGRAYTVAASAFDAGLYNHFERDSSHAVTLDGTGGALNWRIVATRFRFDHDSQRTPTGALPSAFTGGAGTITRLDGTGWETFDASLSYHAGPQLLSAGGHIDRFTLASNRYATADWLNGSEGALNLRSTGRTRTAALWAQDAWTIAPTLTLTVGGRMEWWRAYDGVNFSTAPAVSVQQPARDAAKLSPKAALAWNFVAPWTVRLSYGEAYRFPTVSELYQVVTSPVAAIPDPSLKPEHARSAELAIERGSVHGNIRLSFFGEWITNALISQSGLIGGNISTFVQNVDRTRARGVELAAAQDDLIRNVDVSGSVTYADAITARDAALPAAEGKLLPQVPRWRATIVTTWRPLYGLSLTATARYASRNWATIDHSDTVQETYQGFGHYLVADLRARIEVDRHLALGLGVDNVTNDRYFLFHPFPQRTFHADVSWKL